jgi:signal transduction histidine kinase
MSQLREVGVDGHRDGVSTPRRSERLIKITSALADAVTPVEVFQAIVDEAAAALDASSAGLWLVAEDGKTAALARSRGYSDRTQDVLRTVALDQGGGLPIVDCIREKAPIWIDSQAELLRQYPGLAEMVSPGRSYAIACLPINLGGQIRGALGFTFEDSVGVDGEERRLLALAVRHSGHAIERLRLYEAERKSRAAAEAAAARLAVLNRASRAFSRAGYDLPNVLQAIVAEITATIADSSAVMLVNEAGDALELAAIDHRLPEAKSLVAAAPLRIGEGLMGGVAASGEPLLLNDLQPEALLGRVFASHRPLPARLMPKSMIVVPLRSQGRVIGVLNALRHADASGAVVPFAVEDQQLFEELADRAATAIEASRFHAGAERGRVRAELLYGLARAVIAATSPDEVFAAALDAIEAGLATQRSSILGFDPDGVMRFLAWRGLSDDYRRAVEGHSPWTRDDRAPAPIFIPDVERDATMAGYQPLFRSEGIGALGFIPLVAGGRLVGKFMVYYEHPRVLAAHEIELALAIANHAAAAITRFAAVVELQETVRFNEMFTGILGHDLRNPLAGIMTAAQLCTLKCKDEGVLKPLARIMNSGTRMARMIDQLLDFTRIRVGSGLPLEPRDLDLVPLLRQVVDELEDASPGWRLRVEDRGNTEGCWDGDRLSQVFSNLIGNAVQHGTPDDGVIVRVDGSANGQVRVAVWNRGVVPAALLPRLFEPMAGGQRRRDKSQGLGLGLFISNQIVRAHGGRLEVQSSEAEGTTITAMLPRHAR